MGGRVEGGVIVMATDKERHLYKYKVMPSTLLNEPHKLSHQLTSPATKANEF
jgi:hypothetical protein